MPRFRENFFHKRGVVSHRVFTRDGEPQRRQPLAQERGVRVDLAGEKFRSDADEFDTRINGTGLPPPEAASCRL